MSTKSDKIAEYRPRYLNTFDCKDFHWFLTDHIGLVFVGSRKVKNQETLLRYTSPNKLFFITLRHDQLELKVPDSPSYNASFFRSGISNTYLESIFMPLLVREIIEL